MPYDELEDWTLIYEAHEAPPTIDGGRVATKDVLALAKLDLEQAAHLLEDLYNIAQRLAQEVVHHRWNEHGNNQGGE